MAPGGLVVGPYSQSERIAVVVADVSLKAELYIGISSCFLHKRLASSRSVPSTIEEACGRASLSKVSKSTALATGPPPVGTGSSWLSRRAFTTPKSQEVETDGAGLRLSESK